MKAVFVMLMASLISGNVLAQAIPVEALPGLPKAISNNAVTLVEKSLFGYSFVTGEWQRLGDLPRGTMDHRGLLFSDGWYYLAGGMHNRQAVTADVYRFRIE